MWWPPRQFSARRRLHSRRKRPTRTTGKIKSVDVMRHVITLEDGSTYKVARGVNIKRMKAGEKVTVTTSKFGGTVEASAITPAVD